jgi:hypothetical protein
VGIFVETGLPPLLVKTMISGEDFPKSIRQVGMSKSKVFRSNVTMASSHGAAAFASRQRLDANLPRDFPWKTEEKSVESRGNYGKSWEYHGRCQRMPGRGSFESRR